MSERCEWNPVKDAPATGENNRHVGCQNTASLSVGADGNWHLCASCAALPRFAKYRSRRPLARVLTEGVKHA